MSLDDHNFVSWEEHILCHERGNRVVHYFLKDASGDLVLAVIGTERSIRHMMYVVSDDFVQAYGSKGSVNACTKWRARREVVEWLTSLVSSQHSAEVKSSPMNDSALASSMNGSIARQTCLPDQMVSRKLKIQSSEIVWSGVAWICAKQLKHYPAFCRNGTTIAVHSFVFIMATDDCHYLGYLEDMYEDKKGLKKVKVRWFHHNQELKDVIAQLNPHPREVFITPNVQVISAECIDGPATVLTPKHYEQCKSVVAHESASGIHMCFRQFKNYKLKPFAIAKLRGYSNQAIIASLDGKVVPQQKASHEENKDESVQVGSKRNRNNQRDQRIQNGNPGVRYSVPGNEMEKGEPSYPKLKFKLSNKLTDKKTAIGTRLPMSFKVGQSIELLCQDSGIRGCWFRCNILHRSQKLLKVQYDDVQDEDGPGNLKELVPAIRVAAPDKLGMRCSGRLTVRPCPPRDFKNLIFEVGTPVDAWWCDGWWEGVVTGAQNLGNDTVQVYFPGEERFLTVQKNNLRASKDWDGSKWIDVKARPDILLYISGNVSLSKKFSIFSATAEASGSKVHRAEAIEGGQELPDLATSLDLLKIVTASTSKNPDTRTEGKTNNFTRNNVA
ncbi:hypothetical protein UlMin_016596 [Ulmus minor]